MDFDALVLAPNYATFGRDATLTPAAGSASTVKVIDHTQGVAVLTDDPGQVGIATTVPAVNIRETDLTGIDPVGGTLLMGGVTWDIDSTRPVIGPNGIGTGERQLFLSEPDDP